MPRLRAWFCRLFGLLCKRQRESDIAEEMQHHVDLLIERNVAKGMSANEARTAALRQFGGVEQAKEIAREQRIWRWRMNFYKICDSVRECFYGAPDFRSSQFFV